MTWHVMAEGRSDCPHERYVHYTLTVVPPIPGVECLECGRKIEVWPTDANPEPWPEHEGGHWSLRETL